MAIESGFNEFGLSTGSIMSEVSDKQKRLAEYLGDPSNVAPISGRFEQAFKDQAKKEEDRRQQIRNEAINPERRGSLKGKWDNVLVGTRKAEQDKFENVKNQTKSQFKTTEGSGLVQRRIGQWEELIMQNAASAEHVNATFAAALVLINAKFNAVNAECKLQEQKSIVSHSNIESLPSHTIQVVPTEIMTLYPEVELFISGETHLYEVKTLVNASYLQSFSKEYQNKPVVLPCGLYNSSDECKTMIENLPNIKLIPNATIDVVSLVMTGANGNSYICLTVIGRSATDGNEVTLLPGEYGSYGLKKIAIFDPSGAHLVMELLVYLVTPLMKAAVVSVEESVVNTVAHSTLDQSCEDIANADSNNSSTVETSAVDSSNHETNSEVPDLPETIVDVESNSELSENPVLEDIVDAVDNASISNECPVEVKDELLSVDNGEKNGYTTPEEVVPNADAANEINEEPHGEKTAAVPDPAFLTPVKGDEGNGTWRATPDVNEGEGTWRVQQTPARSQSSQQDDGEDGDEDADLAVSPSDALNPLTKDGIYNFGRSASVAQSTTQSKYISPATEGKIGISASLGASSPSVILQSPMTTGSSLVSGGGGQWKMEDEMDADMLPFGSETMIPICIDDIQCLSTASNGLVIQCSNHLHQYHTSNSTISGRRGSWGAKQPVLKADSSSHAMSADIATVIITGTLKHTVVASSSMFLLENDKLFEYVRGAAMSGWLIKWPMKTQKAGRRTRRFFILRDENLSYHKKPPANMKEYIYGEDSYAVSSMKLEANSSIAKGYKRFSSCIITTTQQNTLWMKGADKHEDDRWVDAISTSINNLNRRPLFLTKPRIECIWHHESNKNFRCLAMDAVSSASSSFVGTANNTKYHNILHYIHVALFCFVYHRGSQTASSSASSSAPPERKIYSIDIGGDELERKQLEIIPSGYNMNSKYEEIASQLSCVKLMCCKTSSAPLDRRKHGGCDTSNMVLILAGSNGFISVGTIGTKTLVKDDIIDTSALTQERHSICRSNSSVEEEVVFCDMDMTKQYQGLQVHQVVTPSTKSNSGKGTAKPAIPIQYSTTFHSADSDISAVSTNADRMIFVSGDNHGGLGLWKLIPYEDHKIRTYSNSNINKFTYESMPTTSTSQLAVSGKLESFLNVNSLQSNSHNKPVKFEELIENGGFEKVNNVQFLPSGLHVAVSTTRRFLLLGITPLSIQTAGSSPTRGSSHNSAVNYILSYQLHQDTPTFLTWTVLDRSAPLVKSLFSLSLEQYYAPQQGNAAIGTLQTRITVWKLIGGEENMCTDGNAQQCTLYRFKWTDEMLDLAMQRSQPIASDSHSATYTYI